jgi:hypothetical protein
MDNIPTSVLPEKCVDIILKLFGQKLMKLAVLILIVEMAEEPGLIFLFAITHSAEIL